MENSKELLKFKSMIFYDLKYKDFFYASNYALLKNLVDRNKDYPDDQRIFRTINPLYEALKPTPQN